MLEIKMDKVELIEAEKQAKEMGNIAHSITKGQGNIAGFLAELAVAKYYGASQKNTYNYDLVMPNGTTIDVNGMGAKTLQQEDGTAITDALPDLDVNRDAEARYNGSVFFLIGF